MKRQLIEDFARDRITKTAGMQVAGFIIRTIETEPQNLFTGRSGNTEHCQPGNSGRSRRGGDGIAVHARARYALASLTWPLESLEGGLGVKMRVWAMVNRLDTVQ